MDRKEAMKWTGDLDFKPGELEKMGTGFSNPQWKDWNERMNKKYAYLIESQKKKAAQARKELGLD